LRVVSAVPGDDISSNGAVEGALDIAVLSFSGLATTVAVLDRTVVCVVRDCREISEILASLSDALQVIAPSEGGGQDWGGFGLVGLPIVGALRAVKGVAGQYVKAQTGTPLRTWTDFVASSQDQFTTFLAALDTVTGVAGRYRTADAVIDAASARVDLDTLADTRWETRAWKQVLGRVAQLGQVVDAILRVDLGGDADAVESSQTQGAPGFGGSLQRRFKEVQSRTMDKSAELREWVLHPFMDIKDRVVQLPAQVARVSKEVALLEVLLDLEMAQIRSRLGEVSAAEAEVIRVRVATSVLVPELAHQIADAKQQAGAYETRLRRLRDARDDGAVEHRAYALLAQEYAQALQDAQSRLSELDVQAQRWRRDGPAILDACADWTALELDLLAARRIAEEADTRGDHQALLQRERERLDEARELLQSL